MVGIIRKHRTMTGHYNGGLNKIFRENITEFKTRVHFGHVRKMEKKIWTWNSFTEHNKNQ
jgi:D-mannonate dehydratase